MSTEIDSLTIRVDAESQNASRGIDALATSLERLRNSAKLTRVVNNLNKLSGALNSIQSASSGLGAINQIASAMQNLASVEKASGLTSTLNALKKIPELTNQLNSHVIRKFTLEMQLLARALEPLSERIASVTSGFQLLPGQVNRATGAVNRLGNSHTLAAQAGNVHKLSLMGLYQTLTLVTGQMHQVAAALASTVNEAKELDGIVNRFAQAFKTESAELHGYVQMLSETLYINEQQFMQYMGIFGSLANGFGVAEEKVVPLSKGLTELSYDVYAYSNDLYTLEEALNAVRSAITGELEPIRNAGIALSEAMLQETAFRHGITQSMDTMTEAQKVLVRYTAMVEQFGRQGAIGTYAKELSTAEGMIRALKQQIKSLAQAIGSLFIPVLTAVLPYIIAFVKVVTSAVRALAALFGYNLAEIDWSNYQSGAVDSSDAITGVGDAADAAGKKMKKLQDYTMGFDELNVIQPPSDTGGSGGAGGGAGLGNGYDLPLDIESLWDASVFDQVNDKVKALIPIMEKVLKIAAAIGAAFLAWKIGTALFSGFKTVRAFLKDLDNGLRGIPFVPATASFVSFSSAVIGFATALAGSKILSKGVVPMIVGETATLGSAIAGIAAFASGVAALVIGFIDVYNSSENFRNGLKALGDMAIWAFNGIKDGIGWAIGKLKDFGGALLDSVPPEVTGFFNGFLNILDALDLSLGDFLITAGGLALFGPWGLAIEGAVLAIKGIGYAAEDALQPVDLFGEGISDITKEKVEPFIQSMDNLDNTLATIDWSNAVVSESDVKNVGDQLKKITETILNELDSDRNQALAKLDPLREAMSEQKFADLQGRIEQSYATQKQTILDGENEINQILATAKAEGRAITDAEAKQIEAIQANMKETGIRYLSESETESNLILQRLKDNATQLSAEQASEIIKSAIKSRDETKAAAKEQYDGIMMEAQRMLDTKTITKTEYDQIAAAAAQTRDQTIQDADTQYAAILETATTQMGEYRNMIDTETGEILSRWEVFMNDMSTWYSNWTAEMGPKWDAFWNGLGTKVSTGLTSIETKIHQTWENIKGWWSQNVAPKLTLEYWVEKLSTIGRAITQTVKNGINSAIQLLNNFIDWVNEHLTWTIPPIKIMGVTVFPGATISLANIPHIPMFAEGGFPEDGQMFIAREAGPELVGSIGGRTAVANNDQIVEAVARGVYDAVMSALANRKESEEQNINVYLDGEQLTNSIEKHQRDRGRVIMAGGLI